LQKNLEEEFESTFTKDQPSMTTNEKKKNGQFAKGTSGNPAGRPPGSRNQSTLLLESLLEGEAYELGRKAIELAKGGDVRALQLCMDRMLPPRKDRPVIFDLRPIQNLDDISVAMMGILAAISEGNITPLEGEAISRILTSYSEVMVNQDLQQRVEKLEHPQPPDEGTVPIDKVYR
jgi:Family of unknown function (DUF5681)